MKINSKTQYIVPAIKVVNIMARRVMANSNEAYKHALTGSWIESDNDSED